MSNARLRSADDPDHVVAPPQSPGTGLPPGTLISVTRDEANARRRQLNQDESRDEQWFVKQVGPADWELSLGPRPRRSAWPIQDGRPGNAQASGGA